MAYTSAEARQELLDGLAAAIEPNRFCAGGSRRGVRATRRAQRREVEAELFGPVQLAYGRAKSMHARFAERHGIPSRTFATPSPGIPSIGAKGFIDSAVNAAAEADSALSALQDSSLPTEVGDVELRASLTEVRDLLGDVRQRARELERTLGR